MLLSMSSRGGNAAAGVRQSLLQPGDPHLCIRDLSGWATLEILMTEKEDSMAWLLF